MRAKVTVVKMLEGFWGVDDVVAEVGEDEGVILELIQEDLGAFLEGAEWKVEFIPEGEKVE